MQKDPENRDAPACWEAADDICGGEESRLSGKRVNHNLGKICSNLAYTSECGEFGKRRLVGQ
jgi:hypothetical protein